MVRMCYKLFLYKQFVKINLKSLNNGLRKTRVPKWVVFRRLESPRRPFWSNGRLKVVFLVKKSYFQLKGCISDLFRPLNFVNRTFGSKVMHFLAFKVGSAVSYDCSRLFAREILEKVFQMSPFHSPSKSSKVAFLEFYCLLKNWEHCFSLNLVLVGPTAL